jgi:CheY-like chemotaxis protein
MAEKHVLVIEDSPDDFALTEMAFRKARMPHKMVVAWDGVEALDYLFCRGKYTGRDPNGKPALILLDLKLPRLDGFDVLKVIRSDKNTCSIPVVVLTSSTEEKDMAESLSLGAKGFTSKPTSFSQFVEVIQQVSAKWLS